MEAKYKSILEEGVKFLSEKDNKFLLAKFIHFIQLLAQIESDRAKMMKDIDSGINFGSHTSIDAEESIKILEYLARKSFIFIKVHQDIKNTYGFYDLAKDFQDLVQDMYMENAHQSFLQYSMIINAFLDADPFYFRK